MLNNTQLESWSKRVGAKIMGIALPKKPHLGRLTWDESPRIAFVVTCLKSSLLKILFISMIQFHHPYQPATQSTTLRPIKTIKKVISPRGIFQIFIALGLLPHTDTPLAIAVSTIRQFDNSTIRQCPTMQQSSIIQ